MKAKKKKTIAKHTLGLLGTLILWLIVTEMLVGVTMRSVYIYKWESDIDREGGVLLLAMLIAYPIVYWAVKTIWFDKDKKEESK